MIVLSDSRWTGLKSGLTKFIQWAYHTYDTWQRKEYGTQLFWDRGGTKIASSCTARNKFVPIKIVFFSCLDRKQWLTWKLGRPLTWQKIISRFWLNHLLYFYVAGCYFLFVHFIMILSGCWYQLRWACRVEKWAIVPKTASHAHF